MNRNFRLSLLKDPNDNSEKVIDFTRHDVPAKEPSDITRRRSLMGLINQKQSRPQDEPVPFKQLPEIVKQLIYKMFPEFR